MSLPENPITRKEKYLAAIAGQAVEVPEFPLTREEAYLDEIAKNSGGGGTSDYNQLENQPQIGGETLIGNKSASDLGLASEDDLADKQDALTAGNYIDINNNEISVNRNIIPKNTTYNIKHVSRYNAVVTKYRNGVKQSENNYQYWGGTVWTIDDAFKLVCDRDTGGGGFAYQLLADTIDHTAGYYGFLFDLYETSVGVEVDLVFPDEDTSGQKLIIKSEMDDALATKADIVDYSTTEQKTGQKWIDGKDIYFKIVTITTDDQQGESAYSLGLQATDTVVHHNASIVASNGNIVNSNYYVSDSDRFVTFIKPDNTINMVCASWAMGQTATVIVYYTKTT